MKKDGKFLIIDGSSLLYRAFFALPLLTTSQGIYTNAVYGFTTMLLKVLEEEKPQYAAVAFDKSKKTFRHEQYADYKGRREKTPRELTEQIAYVRSLLAALKIPVVEAEGYEADDLLGTLATQAVHNGIRPVIISGDADVFQLTNIPCEVIFTRRGITQVERYDEAALRDRYGLSARQFVDFKGLKGDTSDNIPGVPGIGEKTAVRLLQAYGSLEGIYDHLHEIRGKVRENLEKYRTQAFLSRRLATIVTDVPLAFAPADFVRQEADNEELRRLFVQLEFKSLLAKLPGETAEVPGKEPCREDFTEVDPGEWEALLAAFTADTTVALLPLTPGSGWQDDPSGIAVALAGRTYYLALDNPKAATAALAKLAARRIRAVLYDAKSWINLCRRLAGREPAGTYFDAALAAYLLDPLENGYPPDKLAYTYLRRILPPPPGKKREGPAERKEYACAAVRALYDLYPLLRQKLAENRLDRLYHELELPLAQVLARMEFTGVKVDTAALTALESEYRERAHALEERIYELAGEEFNLNSPKQLSRILFEKLGLPAGKKTKTGYSTDAEVLEELAPYHEIVASILQYRTLVKLLGTYLEGLTKLINRQTGRIHTTFHQTVTATGRLSSSDPNLQNIPIRLEEGRRIRCAFVPGRRGSVLLSADYSQIELRVMAHLSGDNVLISAFRREEDIHTRTAAEVFGVEPDKVTPDLRNRAKAVNFGIIYGISDYGLSRQLGITRQEARAYIERYFERLPGVKAYTENIVARAKRDGYVTTILNRRRFLPEINSRNYNLRSFAERTAMNTPVQGSAADIIKLAMLRIEEKLQPYAGRACMILQVHDELVFETEKALLPDIAGIVRREMEEAIELSVPLTVELKAGPNWAQLEEITV
ncbi:MAG TPA: DNA polymerase I [Firmicutes bacterium]|nr:DNA polymerase I [Bacillota bacterium]